MKDYEYIEHTADIGIRVYGENLEELFRNAAKATFNLITKNNPSEDKERKLRLESKNTEDLLINWLNELISIFFTYKFLPKSYNISIKTGVLNKLQAQIKGSIYDPYSQKINQEIKAATYHNLNIEKISKGYKAEIIFDV